MNIGDVAQRSGLPAKTIRYYEEIGLITPDRGTTGYRSFSQTDLHSLTFLARARTLGFTIEDCRALLELYADDRRASADVKRIASGHLTQISDKIAQLQAMHDTLSELVECCQGDERPDCPILRDLAAEADGGSL